MVYVCSEELWECLVHQGLVGLMLDTNRIFYRINTLSYKYLMYFCLNIYDYQDMPNNIEFSIKQYFQVFNISATTRF